MNASLWTVAMGAATLLGALMVVRRLSRRRRVRVDGPRRVLIVGSSRGIGLCTAVQLAAMGDQVVITSRDASIVDRAPLYGVSGGVQCDVTSVRSISDAFASARTLLGGRIDMVVAMQARGTGSQTLVETAPEDIAAVVATNLTGTLLLAHHALACDDVRDFCLVGGGGTNGRQTANYAVYGATKACFAQLQTTLMAEQNRVGIHLLVPGMALTELLMGAGQQDMRARPPAMRRIFNILAETPEEMGTWMAAQLRQLHDTGSYAAYLTPLGVAWRFLRARWMRNRLIDEATGALMPSAVAPARK